MSYSLFGNESNFTEVLFGKTDADNNNERNASTSSHSYGWSSQTHSTASESSSDNNESPNNLFLLKVLDSLLEVCHCGYKIHLATHRPPPPPPPISGPLPRITPVHPRQPIANIVPSPRRLQYPAVLPRQQLHPIVPLPLIPTPQMMSFPPPPIRYYIL